MQISRYWKAIAAAVVAGGGALGTALEDGVVTGAEMGVVAGAVLAALGAVWRIPNRPAPVEEA